MPVLIIGQSFEEKMAERLAEDMFGQGPDERVRALRETVLGPQPLRIVGLAQQIDQEEPDGRP